MYDVVSVEIKEGYLTLRSQESLELFNSLIDSGELFKVLSVLFDDYAHNKTSIDHLASQISALVSVNKQMLKTMEGGVQISAPQGREELIIEEPIKVKEVALPKPQTQKKKKKSGSKVDNLNALKSRFNKIK